MKKVFTWYNILVAHDLIDLEEPASEEPASEQTDNE
jgi:hypothetical protein